LILIILTRSLVFTICVNLDIQLKTLFITVNYEEKTCDLHWFICYQLFSCIINYILILGYTSIRKQGEQGELPKKAQQEKRAKRCIKKCDAGCSYP